MIRRFQTLPGLEREGPGGLALAAMALFLFAPLPLQAQNFDYAPFGGGTSMPHQNTGVAPAPTLQWSNEPSGTESPAGKPSPGQQQPLYPGLGGFSRQGSDEPVKTAPSLQNLSLSDDYSGAGFAAHEARFNLFFDPHSVGMDAEAEAVTSVIADYAREVNAAQIIIIASPDGQDPAAGEMSGLWSSQIRKALIAEGIPPGARITIRQSTGAGISLPRNEDGSNGLLLDRKRVEVVVFEGTSQNSPRPAWR